MKKHHKERLLRLADLLDGVRPRMFNLGTWYTASEKRFGQYHDSDNPDCRTVACAIGWAASDPWFRRRGLRLVLGQCGYTEPVFKTKRGWTACEHLFGLDPLNAVFLFMAECYSAEGRTQPRTVAKRIREFVAEKAA